MKKQVIIGSALTLSLLMIPVVAQARHGADNPIGHVGQQDKLKTTTTTPVTTVTGDDKVTTNTAPTGTVLSTTSSTTTPTVASDSTVTLEEAVATAQKQFPDKTVKETEKESEDGKQVWEVEFTDGTKVEIDATTGAIIESKDKVNVSLENRQDGDHISVSGESHRSERATSDDR